MYVYDLLKLSYELLEGVGYALCRPDTSRPAVFKVWSSCQHQHHLGIYWKLGSQTPTWTCYNRISGDSDASAGTNGKSRHSEGKGRSRIMGRAHEKAEMTQVKVPVGGEGESHHIWSWEGGPKVHFCMSPTQRANRFR